MCFWYALVRFSQHLDWVCADMVADAAPSSQSRINGKRLQALVRKQQRESGGLELPHASRTCTVPVIPETPTNFLLDRIPVVTTSVLKNLNSHPRDVSLKFTAVSHTYWINGERTQGSVTGLVHEFANKFDADVIIPLMMNGSRWPRPGYLQLPPSAGIMEQLSVHSQARYLVDLISGCPCNEIAICAEALRLCSEMPSLRDLVCQLALTTEKIKLIWDNNRIEAGNRGTFMHLTFELFLNCSSISFYTVELELFMRYLLTLRHLTAYRTEWCIWATDERLAGSIDFVARREDGQLVLYDWKRSKLLSSKYSNHWRHMSGPLDHLEDCAGIHYRLQLNAYKWILERYYGVIVASMHVVCTHPELHEAGAFVDNVPDMSSEIDAIMVHQRLLAAESHASTQNPESTLQGTMQSLAIASVCPQQIDEISLIDL